LHGQFGSALQWYSALADQKNLAMCEYLDKIRGSVLMMVDEELREEEVDGNNNAMDFEHEWYFALKTIDELV
jgi:hypothetical protein